MKISLLTKRVTFGFLPISFLMAASSVAMGAEAVPAARLLESMQTPTSASQSVLENLKSFEAFRSSFGLTTSTESNSTARPMRVVVNSTVKSEVIVDEDFSKWTGGTQSEPSTEMVTDEQVAELMQGEGWTAFRMYEAGGAGYMDYDKIGSDGAGYLKSPSYGPGEGGDWYYRLTCHVKNVNDNSQTQGLQAFIFNEENSSIISASTCPMEYEEWVDCEWIGHSNTSLTSFMVFGWQGEVLIDGFKLEQLIFPLAMPVVKSAELLPDGSVKVMWEKVEGATGYRIEVIQSAETLLVEETGDVDSCTLNFDFNSDGSYVYFYVTACNGEDISYPGVTASTLSPQYVGETVAKAATEVTADGFTANWEAADFASNYLVMPTLTHTAVENGEEFYYLNELFANVPESADEYSPIQVAPLLGMEGADILMSRAGWTIDLGVFLRLAPEMPVLALTNQYAAYGLPGSLTSPLTDYSVGNGSVKVSGMAVSGADDVVMECCFMNAAGEIYSSETFEVTTAGDMFEVELTGGQADSYFVLKINETVDGGDMVMIPMLSVSTVLNEGETVTVPAETVHAGKVTEARVEAIVDENNKYSYCVQGYYSISLMGAVSESVEVGTPNGITGVTAQNKAYVSVCDGIISLINPAGLACEVYTLDGRCVFATSSDMSEVRLARGMYVVRIGDKSFKVLN